MRKRDAENMNTTELDRFIATETCYMLIFMKIIEAAFGIQIIYLYTKITCLKVLRSNQKTVIVFYENDVLIFMSKLCFLILLTRDVCQFEYFY